MALNLALDVNRYVDYANGVPEAVEAIRGATTVALPFVVLAELRSGFRSGTRMERNEQRLVRFLQSDRVRVLFSDEATTHVYAMIHAELRKAGTPIPTNDMWIAALVMQHDFVLFSRDRHFDRVPRIARI